MHHHTTNKTENTFNFQLTEVIMYENLDQNCKKCLVSYKVHLQTTTNKIGGLMKLRMPEGLAQPKNSNKENFVKNYTA